MNNGKNIVIATSIVPRNIMHQQSAISSWQSLGFEVISLNSPSEVEVVQSSFPTVTFVPAERTAEVETGKPYIYFDDVRTVLTGTGAEICGIINSDIHLLQRDELKVFIEREAKEGVLFGSRIDVDEPQATDGETYFVGFDFFFFDRRVLDCYPTSDFCLGAPWWDYWAPAIPLVEGIPCKELISPIAFHLKHETKWASDLFYRYGNRIAEELHAISASATLDKTLSAGIIEVMTTKDFNIFSFVVLQYILDAADQIAIYPQTNGKNRLVSIGNLQFESMRRQLVERSRECWCLTREYERLGTELEAGMDALQSLQSSLSWRITAPLRKLLDLVRR